MKSYHVPLWRLRILRRRAVMAISESPVWRLVTAFAILTSGYVCAVLWSAL